VEIEAGDVGNYVDKVESEIKETYRSVKRGLAWELPSKVEDSVT
jgi:hypothetical protein